MHQSPPTVVSSGGGLLAAHPPLRTVRESFPSYGSSRSNRCTGPGHAAVTERRMEHCELSYAPRKTAALLEVFGVALVIGIGCPPDLDMAFNHGTSQQVE